MSSSEPGGRRRRPTRGVDRHRRATRLRLLGDAVADGAKESGVPVAASLDSKGSPSRCKSVGARMGELNPSTTPTPSAATWCRASTASLGGTPCRSATTCGLVNTFHVIQSCMTPRWWPRRGGTRLSARRLCTARAGRARRRSLTNTRARARGRIESTTRPRPRRLHSTSPAPHRAPAHRLHAGPHSQQPAAAAARR